MERIVDVVVIGGGPAGAAVALQLGRVRRSVLVVDAGQPRNAPSAHMQGYLGHDGVSPAQFSAITREELDAYGVGVVDGRILSVVDDDDTLLCATADGHAVRARRVVVASGLTDVLPDLDGVAEMWGDRVIHCPWCHGWEVRDQRVAVIDTSGLGSHQAQIFAQLTDHITLVRNHSTPINDDELEQLRLLGVAVETRPALRIAATGDEIAVILDDTNGDPNLIVDVAVVAPNFTANADAVADLVEMWEHPSGLGHCVRADEFGATSHPKIIAVGNVADPMQQVLHAAAHGSKAATMLNTGLIHDDIEAARDAARRGSEWDERYGGHDDEMWSGKPNGTLITEASRLSTGRALDVGCGEGADSIWLAQQGWNTTGIDVSAVAVERARRAAARLEVDVEFSIVDAVSDPLEAASFELITLAYPALRKPEGRSAIRSIGAAVAEGGRLIVIGHVQDERSLAHARQHGFEPNDYISVDDVIDILRSGFDIEIDAERPRRDAPADAHHTFDRVLVARRKTTITLLG